MEDERDTLPLGTQIDCYLITKILGKGGFSLIYLAEDEDTGDEVVIKEYMPKKLAARDEKLHLAAVAAKHTRSLNRGRKLFYQEAKVMASLHHPNVVRVMNFFLTNNTSYIVMEHQPGKNLGVYVRQRQGAVSTTFMLQVFLPILNALTLIHSRSLLHLDIKPSNIHLRSGIDPLLLDFGAVYRFTDKPRRRRGQVVTAGYSPVEQYYQGGYVGPWSDVYAAGASMRACIEGKPPPSAIDRHAHDTLTPATAQFKDRFPAYLLESIDWAMEMDPQGRPQDAGVLFQALRKQHGRSHPGSYGPRRQRPRETAS